MERQKEERDRGYKKKDQRGSEYESDRRKEREVE